MHINIKKTMQAMLKNMQLVDYKSGHLPLLSNGNLST